MDAYVADARAEPRLDTNPIASGQRLAPMKALQVAVGIGVRRDTAEVMRDRIRRLVWVTLAEILDTR
jgi:hypothetical protein